MSLKAWEDAIPWLSLPLRSAKRRAYAGDSSAVLPPKSYCFHALEAVAPDAVRVVVLGQDPYHTPGKAWGLAFGYHPEYKGVLDSSLLNIVAELGADSLPFDTSLKSWTRQGVLLLNTRLSVLAGKPLSHAGEEIGWEKATGMIIQYLAKRQDIVWLLFGSEAQASAQKNGIDLLAQNVICTSHPCKFSHKSGNQPFTGSNCFLRANSRLRDQGHIGIQWTGMKEVSHDSSNLFRAEMAVSQQRKQKEQEARSLANRDLATRWKLGKPRTSK